MKRVLLYIGIALAAIGCTKDPDVGTQSGENVLTITSNIASRADKSSWGEDDAIGVFVASDGGSFDDSDSNVKFTTSGDGIFTSENPLYLPSGKSKILAYYPWVDGIDYQGYPIESDDQVDLLSAINDDVTSPTVEMIFNHMLSKVSFTIKAGGGLVETDLTDLVVTLSGIYTKASFNLESSEVYSFTDSAADLTLTTPAAGTSSSAIVIPQTLSGATLTFKTEDYGTFSANVTTAEFEVGMEYKYTATINRTGVEITGSNIEEWDEYSDAGVADIVDLELKSGTYYINSAKGLAAFSDLVYGGSNSKSAIVAGFEESEFGKSHTTINGVLTRDVDLSEICGDGIGNWNPIGRFYSGTTYSYEGTFDGGGHKVSGLYINGTSQQALFGYVHADGLVCNLGVSGSVTGSHDTSVVDQVAGLAANNYGNIYNCYSDVVVSGQRNVGGIAAHNTGNVVNCYNHGNITSTYNNAGGIVGYNQGGYVGYCYNTGEVVLTTSEEDARHGGVVGYNDPGDRTDDTVKGSFCLNNTDFSIGQVGATTSTGTLNTNVCYSSYLTSETFVTTMNNGAATYNSVYSSRAIDACTWVYNENGYPTHNFGVTPQTVVLDINYNSISYNINSELGLRAFAALVNGEAKPDGVVTSGDDVFFQFGTEYPDIDGRVTTNIALSGDWTPIANYAGTFEGNGYTISGISITSEGSKQGFFSHLGALGVVCNLVVKGTVTSHNTSSDDSWETGGVVAWNEGLIINCSNYITVSGDYNVGGIAGLNSVGGRVVNCCNRGDVSGLYNNIGGLVGQNYYDNGSYGSVYYSYSTGTVSGETGSTGVGGAVGYNVADSSSGGANVSGCYYLTGSASSVIGSGYGAGSSGSNGNEDYFKGSDFLGNLNNNAATYNNAKPDPLASLWRAGSDGYPEHTWSATAE